MAQMVVKGQFQTGQSALDVGITDLMVMEQNGKNVLYASTGQTGGLTAFDLLPSGSVNVLNTAMFNSAWAGSALNNLSLMEVNGTLAIAVAGSVSGQMFLYGVNSNGSIGAVRQISGLSSASSQLLDVSQTDAQTLFMTDASSGTIRAYSIGSNGTLSQAMQVADTQSTYASQVMAIGAANVLNTSYVISASQTDRGISVYRMDGNSLVNTGNAGVNEGLGIMTPTDMRVVDSGGRSFIILASAPGDGQGQSGAITVMELAQDGSLVSTDHVIDTANTHFGNVQSLEVVEADGRTYVIAGGGDDGVTLFVLLPHGRLQLLGTVTGDAGLVNITSLAARFDAGTLHLYAASERERGVTEITVDVSDHGIILQGSHGGGTITGAGLDDILVGGLGNDSILGGAGNDLLEDGLGVDTLNGGNGADIFILRSDFTHDVIQDFQVGVDRLDLSAWPFLYSPGQIGYAATATGAILTWRGETLELFSRNGQTVSFAQVQAAILNTVDRVPDFSAFGGNDGSQMIDGSAINDAINAGTGADTIDGLAGDDYLDAGSGDDNVIGGIGADTILLGDGDDYAEGGDQSDVIYGGDGRDRIIGDRGNDLIYGGNDRDVLRGANGSDTIYGEHGNDAIRGGNSTDLLFGGDGHDRLFGGNGEDLLYGGAGNDRLLAGFQSDYLDGGAGDDFLVGGGGFDTIIGGTGNDTMQGNFNADRFVFENGHGQDVILDFEANSNNEKLVFSDLSTMNSFADVMAVSMQQGAHVLISTGGGNSILLENVLLADLHAQDFIF